MGLVAAVAICLGILRVAMGLGAILLIVIPPAVVRMTAASSQRAEDGREMSFDDKCWAFLSSVGVMIAVLAAGFIAFAVVCIPVVMISIGTGSGGVAVALAVASAAALFAAYQVLRKLWPFKE